MKPQVKELTCWPTFSLSSIVNDYTEQIIMLFQYAASNSFTKCRVVLDWVSDMLMCIN